MSIASQYPRLASLCLTVQNSGGIPFVDATDLLNALTKKGLSADYNRITGNKPPPVSTGYYPWELEANLRRLNQAPSECIVGPPGPLKCG